MQHLTQANDITISSEVILPSVDVQQVGADTAPEESTPRELADNEQAAHEVPDNEVTGSELTDDQLTDADESLPEPRSFLYAALLFGCLATVPFVLIWSWLFSMLMGDSFLHVLPFGVGAGVLFGAMFGATMGYFFQGVAVGIEVSGRRDFQRRLNAALEKVGYKPDRQTEDCFIFQPTARAGWAAGTLWVGIEGERGVVVGPKIYVNRVVKQLDPHAAWR